MSVFHVDAVYTRTHDQRPISCRRRHLLGSLPVRLPTGKRLTNGLLPNLSLTTATIYLVETRLLVARRERFFYGKGTGASTLSSDQGKSSLAVLLYDVKIASKAGFGARMSQLLIRPSSERAYRLFSSEPQRPGPAPTSIYHTSNVYGRTQSYLALYLTVRWRRLGLIFRRLIHEYRFIIGSKL